jgi:hypothetical protein
MLLGLPLIALVFVALTAGTAAGETDFAKSCSVAWCANDRQNDTMSATAVAMLDEQVAQLGCDKVKRLSPRVAVVNAPTTPAEQAAGVWRFDRGVVRTVTFDEAWAAAEAGEVFVLGWCG